MLPFESKPSAKCAKKGKKNKGGGNRLNRLFNLGGGSGIANKGGAAAAESTIEDDEIAEATNGRKNRFMIHAVEKVLMEMRKKKKKGQQSQEHRFVFQNHSSRASIATALHNRQRLRPTL